MYSVLGECALENCFYRYILHHILILEIPTEVSKVYGVIAQYALSSGSIHVQCIILYIILDRVLLSQSSITVLLK